MIQACVVLESDLNTVKPFVGSVVSGQSASSGSLDPQKFRDHCIEELDNGNVEIVLGYEPFLQVRR